VADRGWVPAAAALGGEDAIRVQSVRDRGQALAGFALAPRPVLEEAFAVHERKGIVPSIERTRTLLAEITA